MEISNEKSLEANVLHVSEQRGQDGQYCRITSAGHQNAPR